MLESTSTPDTAPTDETQSDTTPDIVIGKSPIGAIVEKQKSKERRKKKVLFNQSAKELREDFLYDQIPETRRAKIDDGYVEFTKHFKYLGSNVSYNLKDDYDISERITKAFQNMGALKNIWDDPHVDLYSKYLLFLAVPINQLLWGCESWALKESSLNDIDIFITQSIRRIIGISMAEVKENRISNKKLQEKFYNIQSGRNMIAARQLQFLGKLVRSEDSSIPKQLLTAWVNHKRLPGGVLTTTKTSYVKSLQRLYPKNTYRKDAETGKQVPIEIHMDRFGSLKYWIEDAMDEKRWQWMIDSKLRFPHRKIPEPTQNTDKPHTHTQDNQPPRTPPRRNNNNNRERRRNPPPSPPRNGSSQNYDPEGVGRNIYDSLAILGLTLQDDITERHIRRKYMELARKYHPDKNNPEESGRNHEEATQFFQLLNNAHTYLRETL